MKTISIRGAVRKFSCMLFPLALVAPYQNCSEVHFDTSSMLSKNSFPPPPEVCNGISCELTPLTNRPAVTTILLALGDQVNSQLVVNGVSSQLIAESVVRYSTPKENPRILVVRDLNYAGEDPEDPVYLVSVLLSRYNVTVLDEPATGITAAHLVGYDLVWFNNPGRPMSLNSTYQTLLSFSGAIVLQGDDLTRGLNFSMESLTGLRHIDNGSYVTCNGVNLLHDDNGGDQYRVVVDPNRIAGFNAQNINFRYGNDIDNSVVVGAGVEVLASAYGGPSSCTQARPTITRRLK